MLAVPPGCLFVQLMQSLQRIHYVSLLCEPAPAHVLLPAAPDWGQSPDCAPAHAQKEHHDTARSNVVARSFTAVTAEQFTVQHVLETCKHPGRHWQCSITRRTDPSTGSKHPDATLTDSEIYQENAFPQRRQYPSHVLQMSSVVMVSMFRLHIWDAMLLILTKTDLQKCKQRLGQGR